MSKPKPVYSPQYRQQLVELVELVYAGLRLHRPDRWLADRRRPHASGCLHHHARVFEFFGPW